MTVLVSLFYCVVIKKHGLACIIIAQNLFGFFMGQCMVDFQWALENEAISMTVQGENGISAVSLTPEG